MGNAVGRQGEGLRGGREAPPPRVARTGLGAGLGRAGRAPEGAGRGGRSERRRGRAQECGLRWPRWWRKEVETARGLAGRWTCWVGLVPALWPGSAQHAARLLGPLRCWSLDALPSRNRETGTNGFPSAQPIGAVGCDFPVFSCGADSSPLRHHRWPWLR